MPEMTAAPDVPTVPVPASYTNGQAIDGEAAEMAGAPEEEANDRPARCVVGRSAAEIIPAPVRWAWQDRVPLGSVTLNVGREGVGKGVFSTHLAARWSRGQLPGDLRGKPVNVAMLSIEDSAHHVLRPRLEAAGADLDRVLLKLQIRESDGYVGTLAFPGDIEALADYIVANDVVVLVIDVATAFMNGLLDAHKDHDVRRGLMTPLGEMAERFGIAVVINHHLNRAPSTLVLDRIAGSLGVSRAARSVLAVVENPDEETERVVVVAKSNLGVLEVPAIRFRIEGAEVETPTGPALTGQAVILGETDMVTARNALRARDDDRGDEESSAREEAAAWLVDLLGAEPVPAAEVKSAASKAGIAWATVRRAKVDAGVESRRWGRPGEEGGWCWALTACDSEGAHDGPKVPTYLERASSVLDGHLRAETPSEDPAP